MWENRDNAEIMEEIWNKLYPLREKTKNYSELDWQKHTNPVTGKFQDSNELFMCGIVIRKNKKWIAELHIQWMPWINNFSISSLIRNHRPKNISGEYLEKNYVDNDPVKNLELLFLQFEKYVNQLTNIIDEGKDLKKNLPKDWYGENVFQGLKKLFINDPIGSLKFISKIIFYPILFIFIIWVIFFSDAFQENRSKFLKIFSNKKEIGEIQKLKEENLEIPNLNPEKEKEFMVPSIEEILEKNEKIEIN